MAGSYPDLLAHGVEDAGRFDQFDLFAGSGPWNTTQMQVADGLAVEQFQVLAADNTGHLIEYSSGQTAVAIAAQPMDASTPGKFIPVFVSGGFNHEALVWPSFIDTLGERQSAFVGSPIYVQQLL
jgi:Bacteriophage lambda head decoration protein D